jgi:hypothetical protein
MRAVPADAVRRFFAERAEWQGRFDEEAAMRAAEAGRRVRVSAVPALERQTPYQSMVAAAGLVTPEQECSGREPANFMAEQIDASARALAERRAKRAAEAAEKQRLAGRET